MSFVCQNVTQLTSNLGNEINPDQKWIHIMNKKPLSHLENILAPSTDSFYWDVVL